MNRLLAGGLAAIVVLLLVAYSSFFVVSQTRQALIIQFGQPVREIRAPGLYVKAPWQDAVFYDRRLLDFEADPQNVNLSDQKRLIVDAYARYRIVNPLQFYQTSGSEARLQRSLGGIIAGAVGTTLGNKIVLNQLLSQDRDKVIGEVRQKVADQARQFGIEVVDVRIRRADLPEANSNAIYARMRSERQREANEYRAQGQEQAQGIRARAERDRTVILAEADKQSQILRGQGDADSIKIYADAFGKDQDFFTFYRSLQAYREAIGPDTTMVLSPNSEFFQFFEQHKAAKPQ